MEGGGRGKGEWSGKECKDHSHQSLKDQLSIFLTVIVQNFKQAIQRVLWVRLRYMHLPGSPSRVSYTHTHLQELDHLLPSHVNHIPQDHRKFSRSLSPLQQKQQLNLREAEGEKEGGIEGGREGDRKNGEKE